MGYHGMLYLCGDERLYSAQAGALLRAQPICTDLFEFRVQKGTTDMALSAIQCADTARRADADMHENGIHKKENA